MLIDHYHERAGQTARYPDRGRNPVYPALGLAGESGEVCEKILLYRIGEVHADAVCSELGDTLWYQSALAFELGLSLTAVAGVASFTELADLASADDRPDDLLLLGLELASCAGRCAERMKKVLRDREGVVDSASREATALALRDHLLVAASLAALLGSSLDSVAEANLHKLASRAEREVLHGEGDTR